MGKAVSIKEGAEAVLLANAAQLPVLFSHCLVFRAIEIVQGDLRQQVESELDTAEARIEEISHRLERRRSAQLRPSSLELIEFHGRSHSGR